MAQASGEPEDPASGEPVAQVSDEPEDPVSGEPEDPVSGWGAGPHLVALGGGHGLATTLSALRRLPGRITAVVSVADDGGSSGRLREATGLPAPGDLRRCLVALAPDPSSLWARAFAHRFVGGDLDGHALGNLVIAGLAVEAGDFSQALDAAAELLGVTARVVPATLGPVSLKADVAGREVLGQAELTRSRPPISGVSIVPPDAPASPEACAAVAAADLVVLGPGSLFTSVLATCVVPGIHAALAARRARTVYVCNLRPQVPETEGFSPVEHLRAVLDHGVRPDVVVVDSGEGEAGWDLRGLRDLAAREGVALVCAAVARPGRSSHDTAALATALGGLLARAPAPATGGESSASGGGAPAGPPGGRSDWRDKPRSADNGPGGGPPAEGAEGGDDG